MWDYSPTLRHLLDRQQSEVFLFMQGHLRTFAQPSEWSPKQDDKLGHRPSSFSCIFTKHLPRRKLKNRNDSTAKLYRTPKTNGTEMYCTYVSTTWGHYSGCSKLETLIQASHHRSARLIRKRNQRKNCKRNPNGSQEAAQQDRQVHCNVDQVCLSAHVKPEEHVWCCSLPPVIFHFPKILVVIISS